MCVLCMHVHVCFECVCTCVCVVCVLEGTCLFIYCVYVACGMKGRNLQTSYMYKALEGKEEDAPCSRRTEWGQRGGFGLGELCGAASCGI